VINDIPFSNDINKIIHKTVFKFRLDYLIHFISFLIFISLYFIDIKQGSPIFSEKTALKYLLIVGGAAILFECIQYFFCPIELLILWIL